MRDPKRSELSVEGPPGDRWDLGIRLLTEGRARVMVGELLIYREWKGPAPDPAAPLVVEVDGSHWWRPALPPDYRRDRAENQLADAMTRTAELGRADPRFATLMTEHGVRFELVDDYGNGAIVLAERSSEGAVRWLDDR